MKPNTLFLILSALLTYFATMLGVEAVVPPPDGAYPNFTTAEGTNALKNLTTGAANTGLGWYSLFTNSTASNNTGVGAATLVLSNADENTAVGTAALFLNTSGTGNTATGALALLYNDTGVANTAVGDQALFNNIEGNFNTATGFLALFDNVGGVSNTASGASALQHNTTGGFNTAIGGNALLSNTTGSESTAVGANALFSNVTGVNNTAIGASALSSNHANDNTAIGAQALSSNSTGFANTATGVFALLENNNDDNTAIGWNALPSSTGNSNTALGSEAGLNATTGNGNVYIGAQMIGFDDDSNRTYIRNINTTTVSGGGTDTVTVNLSTGLLGHLSSSRRYKEEIKPMDNASETLYRLKPVTYRFKKDIDATQSLDYGLVAEDVAQVDPNLAIRDGKGQIESVRYTAINAMLLNEFLKEHRTVEKQSRKIQEQETTITQLKQEFESKFVEQQKQIEALTAGLQKVSAQLVAASPSDGGLELNKLAPQVASNP